MKQVIVFILLTLVFSFSNQVFSQVSKDVCCFGVQSQGEGKYLPFAGPKSQSECKTGSPGFREGQRICGFSDNLDACAQMGQNLAEICTKCGLHWIDSLKTCSEKSLEELVPPKEEGKEESSTDKKK